MLEAHHIQNFERRLKGQTKPYLVNLVRGQQAVAKLICHQGCVCFKEFLAIKMAQAIGLNTLVPVQLLCSEALLNNIPENQWLHTQVKRHRLPAFGTIYHEGGMTPRLQDIRRTVLCSQMVAIFCFDAVIRNFDRQSGNPNLLLFEEISGQLYAIDHEMGFLFPEREDLWRIDQEERMKLQAHILYPELKKTLSKSYASTAQTIHACLEKMQQNINEAFWLMIKIEAPESWCGSGDYVKIKTTLEGILCRHKSFSKQVLEVLR